LIRIGLAGWGDHPSLYRHARQARGNLKEYGGWFDIVEVDASFYAIQPERVTAKWTSETPDGFGFIVKAYQGMTGHARGGAPYPDSAAMFAAFRASIEPMRAAGKLLAVLFQYPPWFDCAREHVDKLREAKALMDGIPCALEFRNRSWFADGMRDRTLAFMRREGWIHSVCDEPQAGESSIPIVEEATDPGLTIVRFHGRNAAGWNAGGPGWRDVRYLYRYSEAELQEWRQRLERLEAQSGTVCAIFNNNSGGDAADNALRLMRMLGRRPPRGGFDPPSEPEQMDLFEL
jgi:uncharacterized protein YecE (DUF72 family)